MNKNCFFTKYLFSFTFNEVASADGMTNLWILIFFRSGLLEPSNKSHLSLLLFIWSSGNFQNEGRPDDCKNLISSSLFSQDLQKVLSYTKPGFLISLPTRKWSNGHKCVEKSSLRDWTLRYNNDIFFLQSKGFINAGSSHLFWKITIYHLKCLEGEPKFVQFCYYWQGISEKL